MTPEQARYRRWLLQECIRVQVQKELGSVSVLNAGKERKKLQKELVTLRRSSKGTDDYGKR